MRMIYTVTIAMVLGVEIASPPKSGAQSATVAADRSVATSSQRQRQPADETLGRRSDMSGVGQQSLITITLENLSVEVALERIAKQTGLRLGFSGDVYHVKKHVTLKAKRRPVNEVLTAVLQGTGLRHRTTASGEILIERIPIASAQDEFGAITGRVIDSATGKGLSGVTVSVQGTKLSVITSDRGTYTISGIPVGTRVVHMRLVGYRSATQTVEIEKEKRTTVNAVLKVSASMLSEVVTTVTGTQKKLEIGNDVTTINVDSVIRVAPISNVTDLLETRVPGLTVIRSSGVPGAPSRLRLRGLGGGMLSDREGAPTNDPIVIVDGIRINASQSGVTDQNLAVGPESFPDRVKYSSDYPAPSSIDQIDPNSIEKIDVYKGPSAAALYGSDAANGVIVITTKRGRSGPARWSISMSQDVEYFPGFYAAPGYYPFCHNITALANAGPDVCEFRDMQRSVLDSVVRFQALDESRLTPFGTGDGNALTTTVSGGGQAMNYSVTGSITNKLGLLKMPSLYQDLFESTYDSAAPGWMRRPNLLQTQSFNATFSAEPRQGMRTTFAVRLTNSRQRQSSAQLQLPALSTRYFDTTAVAARELTSYITRVNANRSVADYSLGMNWDVWQAMPLTATFGLSHDSRDDNRFVPNGVQGAAAGWDIYNGATRGSYGAGNAVSNVQTGRLSGMVFPGRKITAALGAEVTKSSSRQVQGRADSLQPGVVVPALLDWASQGSAQAATGGWFVEPRLNLNSRFFVNPGFRFDGSNLSGGRGGAGGGLWSLFPKLNFSWVAIDQEGRTPLLGAISMLRPRLSLGVAGVQPAAGWRLRLMAPPGGVYATTIENGGLELSTLGNTQLHPERTREIEGGFDIDLWSGRLNVSATQFYKMRIDAIEQLAVAPSVYGGSLKLYSNIGQVRNTGTEITFASTVLEYPTISWTVSFSISKYTNKLMSLNSEQPYIDLGDGTRFVAGYPLFGRWSRPIVGYSQSSPGGRLVANDVLVADSAVYVGQQSPNFEMPFNTGVSLFRGLISVNATFQYKDGLTQFNQGSKQQLNNLWFNPDATLADQAAALAASCSIAYANSGKCTEYGLIQTVNSLRFNSLSIGYTVPRAFAKRLNIPSIHLALQGNNLGLWTNYRGKDPDVNGTTVGDVTQDSGQLPEPRTWRFQIRINN